MFTKSCRGIGKELKNSNLNRFLDLLKSDLGRNRLPKLTFDGTTIIDTLEGLNALSNGQKVYCFNDEHGNYVFHTPEEVSQIVYTGYVSRLLMHLKENGKW